MELVFFDYSPLKSKGFYFFIVLVFTTFWYYKLVAFVKNNYDAVIQARRFVAMLLPVLVIIFILSSPINEISNLEKIVKGFISLTENKNEIVFISSVLVVFLSMLFNHLKPKLFNNNSKNKTINIVYKVLRLETINTLFIMVASFLICLVIWLAFLGFQTFVHLVIFGTFFGASLSVIMFGFVNPNS